MRGWFGCDMPGVKRELKQGGLMGLGSYESYGLGS